MPNANCKPELSATLSVDQWGLLRYGDLYAGPIVALHIKDADGKEHVYAGFSSTSEAPHARR